MNITSQSKAVSLIHRQWQIALRLGLMLLQPRLLSEEQGYNVWDPVAPKTKLSPQMFL